MGRSKKDKHASKFILCIDLEGKYELLLDLKAESKVSKEHKKAVERELGDIIARKKMSARIIAKMHLNQKIIVDQIYEEALKETLEKYDIDVVDYFANLRSISFNKSKGRIAQDAKSEFGLGDDAEVVMATSDSKKFLGEPEIGIINLESDAFSMDTKSMVTGGKVHRLGSISEGVSIPALTQDPAEVEMFQVIYDELMPEEIRKLMDKPNKTPDDYNKITKYFEKKLKKEVDELNRARHSNIQRQDELKQIMISRDSKGRRIIHIGGGISQKPRHQEIDGTLPIITQGDGRQTHIDLMRIKNGQMHSVTFYGDNTQNVRHHKKPLQEQKSPIQYSIPEDEQFSHAMVERLLELQRLQKPPSKTLNISGADLYRIAYQTKQNIEARDGIDLSQTQKTEQKVEVEREVIENIKEFKAEKEQELVTETKQPEETKERNKPAKEEAKEDVKEQGIHEQRDEKPREVASTSDDPKKVEDYDKRIREERAAEEREREEARKMEAENLRRMANEGMEMNAGYASVVTYTDAQDAEISKKITAQEFDFLDTSESQRSNAKDALSSIKDKAKDLANSMISSNNAESKSAKKTPASTPSARKANQRQERSRTE